MEETQSNELFTTAEIMFATGLTRGKITNRAKALGFDRTGRGYTLDQVMKIVTCGQHRLDKDKAKVLRGMLNVRLDEENYPLAIRSVGDRGELVQLA